MKIIYYISIVVALISALLLMYFSGYAFNSGKPLLSNLPYVISIFVILGLIFLFWTGYGIYTRDYIFLWLPAAILVFTVLFLRVF